MARTKRHWPKPLSDKRRQYDWDRWLDGQVWSLEKGKDYTVSPQSFTNAARDYAKRHKINIRITVNSGEVHIQAIK